MQSNIFSSYVAVVFGSCLSLGWIFNVFNLLEDRMRCWIYYSEDLDFADPNLQNPTAQNFTFDDESQNNTFFHIFGRTETYRQACSNYTSIVCSRSIIMTGSGSKKIQSGKAHFRVKVS